MSTDELDPQALFDSFNTPSIEGEPVEETKTEPVEETVEVKAEEPVVEETPQPEPEAVAEVETTEEPETAEAKEDEAETQIPKAQYDEIRAKQKADRAALEEANARETALSGRLEQLERMILQSQQKPVEQTDAEEVYIDPDTQNVLQTMQHNFQAQLNQVKVQNSLDIAASKYGDEYSEAEKFVIDQRNPVLAREIMQAPNPGEATVRFFRQNKVLSEVGDDPLKYQENLKENLLKDPAFLEQALASARAQATSQGGNSRSNPKLATSVNQGTRAAPATAGVVLSNENPDPQALFDEVTGRNR